MFRATTARRLVTIALVAVAFLTGCTAAQVQYLPSSELPAPPTSRTATLFLVGDAGEINEAQTAVMTHLGEQVEDAASDGTRTVVAYLGDNVYEVGAHVETIDEDRPKLLAQIEPLGLRDNVQGIFIPGNHDWERGGPTESARASVRLQRRWLAELAGGRDVAFLPADECPGPATVDLPGSLHLVFIDTEWLLRNPTDACGTTDAFYERLSADLTRHRGERVIVMAHHPLTTGGPHGGHIAPFYSGPGIYFLATRAGANAQDIASGDYSRMRRRLESVFEETGNIPLAYAAGHDHNLQVIRGSGPGEASYHLVSGAGAKTSNARRIDGTRYATNGNGYMRLDFGSSEARLIVFARTGPVGEVEAVFSCTMSYQAADTDCREAPLSGEGS